MPTVEPHHLYPTNDVLPKLYKGFLDKNSTFCEFCWNLPSRIQRTGLPKSLLFFLTKYPQQQFGHITFTWQLMLHKNLVPLVVINFFAVTQFLSFSGNFPYCQTLDGLIHKKFYIIKNFRLWRIIKTKLPQKGVLLLPSATRGSKLPFA